MLMTKRYHRTFLTLFFMMPSLHINAQNSAVSDVLQLVFDKARNFFKKERMRRNRLAPEYVQHKARKIYREIESLCHKHSILGQFTITFDRSSLCPTMYHNIALVKQQLGYSEPPGKVIYISNILTKENIINSLEEGIIVREIARCVLGHNNRFSGHMMGLTRGENQLAFEVETLTVFYLLKKRKIETLRKYFSHRNNLIQKFGQLNGLAAFKKEFPDSQLLKEGTVEKDIIEFVTKATGNKMIVNDIQFTRSYKDARNKYIINIKPKL